MDTKWTNRRKGYQYRGVKFSEDGTQLRAFGTEYREKPFSAPARKRFRIWLIAVLLFTFPGIPLLAYFNLQNSLLWIAAIVLGLAYWLHGHIHACPICGGKSRLLKTPHMGAPVLYLCARCRTFFEHGEINGGLPWK